MARVHGIGWIISLFFLFLFQCSFLFLLVPCFAILFFFQAALLATLPAQWALIYIFLALTRVITKDVVPESGAELLNRKTNVSKVDTGGASLDGGRGALGGAEPARLLDGGGLGLDGGGLRGRRGSGLAGGAGDARVGNLEDLGPHLLEELLLFRKELADEAGAGRGGDIGLSHCGLESE